MNNPPAFPRPFSADDVDSDLSYPAHVGMTLRDYFAAKAMQSLVMKFNEDSLDWNAHEESEIAYQIADAMLKAREQ
jgi:hypothetical protein